MNKGELQYYGYSFAVMSALLLELTNVSNLVVTPVCIVRSAYGIPYVGINSNYIPVVEHTEFYTLKCLVAVL